jgi:hypothetical protein
MAVPFSICALSTISWEELVFQFVVINQKAQPIAPEFLHAIANSFLTPSGEKPLWRPESQLLEIAVLQIIQDEFLSWSSCSKQEWPSDIEEFKKLVRQWIERVPRTLFSEQWKGTKSIPSPERRKQIRTTLRACLEDPNYQFRKSRLFKESR